MMCVRARPGRWPRPLCYGAGWPGRTGAGGHQRQRRAGPSANQPGLGCPGPQRGLILMEIKNATAANWIPGASTAQLRDAYLLDSLFATGELRSVYAHEDRMVVGAAVPAGSPLKLEAAGPVRAEYFLQRRELGVVKVGGGPGTVVADGTHHVLEHRDCLYLGQGTRSVEFVSADPSSPARFYFVSTPAYRPCPAQKIAIAGIEPITLGSAADAN